MPELHAVTPLMSEFVTNDIRHFALSGSASHFRSGNSQY